MRARRVRWSLLALVPAGAFAVGWIVVAHALDLLPVGVKAKESGTPLAAAIFGNTGTWLQQMIGVFGWLDTLSPLLTYLVWYAVVGLLVLIALSCARRRHAGALVLLIADRDLRPGGHLLRAGAPAGHHLAGALHHAHGGRRAPHGGRR